MNFLKLQFVNTFIQKLRLMVKKHSKICYNFPKVVTNLKKSKYFICGYQLSFKTNNLDKNNNLNI